jgi:hypothetical protein
LFYKSLAWWVKGRDFRFQKALALWKNNIDFGSHKQDGSLMQLRTVTLIMARGSTKVEMPGPVELVIDFQK